MRFEKIRLNFEIPSVKYFKTDAANYFLSTFSKVSFPRKFPPAMALFRLDLDRLELDQLE